MPVSSVFQSSIGAAAGRKWHDHVLPGIPPEGFNPRSAPPPVASRSRWSDRGRPIQVSILDRRRRRSQVLSDAEYRRQYVQFQSSIGAAAGRKTPMARRSLQWEIKFQSSIGAAAGRKLEPVTACEYGAVFQSSIGAAAGRKGLLGLSRGEQHPVSILDRRRRRSQAALSRGAPLSRPSFNPRSAPPPVASRDDKGERLWTIQFQSSIGAAAGRKFDTVVIVTRKGTKFQSSIGAAAGRKVRDTGGSRWG